MPGSTRCCRALGISDIILPLSDSREGRLREATALPTDRRETDRRTVMKPFDLGEREATPNVRGVRFAAMALLTCLLALGSACTGRISAGGSGSSSGTGASPAVAGT